MTFTTITAIAGAFALAVATAATANPIGNRILTAHFAPRLVDQVEAGDFHFTAGQPAPVHTHAAPAIGYVAAGTIIYQVAGQKARTLSAGDAFYEPVGPKILRFDNGSATKPAVFIDFNLQQAGEPFIVFPVPPTAKIDRRALPTTRLGGVTVDGAAGYALALKPGERRTAPAESLPVFGYVAAGSVTVTGNDGIQQHRAAGETFTIAAGEPFAIANSGTVPAKVIDFYLRNGGK